MTKVVQGTAKQQVKINRTKRKNSDTPRIEGKTAVLLHMKLKMFL